MKTKEELFQRYVDSASGVIHEFSGDVKQSLRNLVDEAREFSNDLDIEWIPELYFSHTDIDIINDYGEDVYKGLQ